MTIPILLIGVPFKLSLHLCPWISVIHEDPLQGVFMQPSTLHFKVFMYLFYLQMTGVLSLETLQSLVWVQFQSYLIFSLWFNTTAYIHQKEMTVMKLLLEVIRCQGRQMTNHWSPDIAVLHNTAIKLQDTGY